jgi:ABC-type nitrate/sulfonate/bicarbonate transport system substrate-binding protein
VSEDIARKVLIAHKNATDWILAHPEEAIELAMTAMSLSQEVATAAFYNIKFVYAPYIPAYVEFLEKLVALNPAIEMDSPKIPTGMTTQTFIEYFVNTTLLESIV